MRFTNLLFAVALIGSVGCAKPNDTVTLHDEVVAINNFYQPAVDALGKRGAAIVERGGKLGVAMPGGEIASRAISMAGQQLAELRNLTAPGSDGKSQLVKQADAAAKDGKDEELQKLADEASEKLETGTRTIAAEPRLQRCEPGHLLDQRRQIFGARFCDLIAQRQEVVVEVGGADLRPLLLFAHGDARLHVPVETLFLGDHLRGVAILCDLLAHGDWRI